MRKNSILTAAPVVMMELSKRMLIGVGGAVFKQAGFIKVQKVERDSNLWKCLYVVALQSYPK